MSDRANNDHKPSEKSFFARTVKNTTKNAKRAQEKVKRKLGKTDETKDEIFDRFVNNFNDQQEAVQRLEKELKNYMACVKAMKNANLLFGEAVKQVYEPDWSEREMFVNLLDSIDVHWNNLIDKLQNEVLDPLSSYQMQFPDTKNRISKRSRKLVDYDRRRHQFETLKGKGGKTGEPKKIAQAEEEYNQAKTVYLKLHSDLYDELPALYDSRIPFYISSFQSIFTAEGVFNRESAKTKTQMSDMLDILAKETSAGTYSTRRPVSVISNASSDGENSPFEQADNFTKHDTTDNSDNGQSDNEDIVVNGTGHIRDIDTTEETKERCTSSPSQPESSAHHPSISEAVPVASGKSLSPVHDTSSKTENEQLPPTAENASPSSDAVVMETENTPVIDNDAEGSAVSQATIPENKSSQEAIEEKATVESPPLADATEEGNNDSEHEGSSEEEKTVEKDPDSRFLYKVMCTHPYNGEDEDELTFEKGEIIQVIMYSDSDDPDDGWLLGINQNGTRGVFPENFTRRMDP